MMVLELFKGFGEDLHDGFGIDSCDFLILFRWFCNS